MNTRLSVLLGTMVACFRVQPSFRTISLIAAVIGAYAAPSCAASEVRTGCIADINRIRTNTPFASSSIPLVVNGRAHAWLTITENGEDVEVDGQNAAASIQFPSRLGVRVFEVRGEQRFTLRRARDDGAVRMVEIELHCDGSFDASANWLRTAAPVAARVSAKSADPIALLKDIDALVNTAPLPPQRALGLHLRAQALLANKRITESEHALTAAENAWLAASMSDPALSARSDRVELTKKTGRLERALVLARAFPPTPLNVRNRRESLFAIGLESQACQIEQRLGRTADAMVCYARTIARFEALGEVLEATRNRIELAPLLLQKGFLEESHETLNTALTSAIRLQSAALEGRALLAFADTDLSKGDIGGSLRNLQEAREAFGRARAPGWQLRTELILADVLVEFGELSEAFALLDRPIEPFGDDAWPVRAAASLVVRARIHARDGEVGSALADLRAAAERYRQLRMTNEFRSVQFARANLLLRAGEKGAAEAVFRTAPGETTSDALVTGAALDLASGRLDAARAKIRGLSGSPPLRISRMAEAARLDAFLKVAAGDRPTVLKGILKNAWTMRRFAETADNPLLGEQLLSLQTTGRETVVDILAQGGRSKLAMQADVEQLWTLITARRTVAIEAPAGYSAPVTAFGRSRAREFMGRATRSTTNFVDSRPLTSLLVRRGNNANGYVTLGQDGKIPPLRRPLPTPTLSQIQAGLPDDAALLAFVRGRDFVLRLWATQTQVRVDRLPDINELEGRVRQLRTFVSDPHTPAPTIEAAASDVGRQLLAGLADASPQHLIVLADDYGGTVPWPVVRWPGHTEPLGVDIDVSLADFAPPRPPVTPTATSLDVLSVRIGDNSLLALLPIASIEPEVVASSVGAFRTVSALAPTRAALLGAMHKPGGWVHVATHGRGGDERIGGSGLWLRTAIGEAPVYVSGADVVGERISAQLIVLNACDVAGSAHALDTPHTNLPRTLIRAGAAHVVAAQWPVSDTATLIWVPAFYERLRSGNVEDAGRALTAARRDLWQSRAFHQPFYWASLVHFRTLR